MWYEALPTLVIIGCAMTSYQLVSVGITKLFFDRPYQKERTTRWERGMFYRDTRIAGVPWKVAGLENIPDK